jgi:hypothetical protein
MSSNVHVLDCVLFLVEKGSDSVIIIIIIIIIVVEWCECGENKL